MRVLEGLEFQQFRAQIEGDVAVVAHWDNTSLVVMVVGQVATLLME